MTIAGYLLLLSTALVLITAGRAQNCELFNAEIIERLFIAGLRQLNPDIQNVTVLEYYVNCLSFANQRDRFTFTTVTVVFNSSLHPGEELAYHDIGCTERSEWDITPIIPIQGIQIGSGRRQNDTRMDCGACATPRVIPVTIPRRGSTPVTLVYDNSTHCYECSRACPDVGQRRCFGLSSMRCCNFYKEDSCVEECDATEVPDENLNCIAASNQVLQSTSNIAAIATSIAVTSTTSSPSIATAAPTPTATTSVIATTTSTSTSLIQVYSAPLLNTPTSVPSPDQTSGVGWRTASLSVIMLAIVATVHCLL